MQKQPKLFNDEAVQSKVFMQGSVYDRYLNKKPALPKNIHCVHCSAKFAKQDHYERHLLVHEAAFERRKNRADLAEYICKVCSLQFLRKSSLQMHAKIHENECNICKAPHKNKKTLDAHMASVHSELKAETEETSELHFDFNVEVKIENEDNVNLASMQIM